jgi:Ca2+-binding EF-hand superfamily protein
MNDGCRLLRSPDLICPLQTQDYEDKKKALNRWFRTADADGSGQLSIHELHTMIQQTGHDIGEKLDMSKLLRILDTLDVDGDGKLSPSEFHHAFMPLSLVRFPPHRNTGCLHAGRARETTENENGA